MFRATTYSSMILSAAFHLTVLAALWFIRLQLNSESDALAIETVVTEETIREEFTQELSPSVEIAETLNMIPEGAASAQIGTSGGSADVAGRSAAARVRVETAERLREPDIRVTAGELAVPSDELLVADLGEREVTGEVGAVVDGYETALSRITQEIIRLLRDRPVLVVWLFDESESMKDDQAEIRANFHKVYEELGLVTEKDKEVQGRGREVLLTAITSFGATVHRMTQRPTADINAIRHAIDRITVDDTGAENLCLAVEETIDEYRSFAQNGKRRVILIVVSDESGDDGQRVDEAIAKARRYNMPVYTLGREAIFGYPFARVRWKDPIFGLDHWLPITRGPETPGPECLQWDGLHARWDSYSSGFGPYEQVRMAKETGGVFFLLPGEEQDLTGLGARDSRKFDLLDMKQYQPSLVARPEYEKSRAASPFRSQIWSVIATLNPHLDDQLNIRELYYPSDPAQFREEGKVEFEKAVRAMRLADQAAKLLEKLAPLREREDSPRWRAAYDLAFAQCLAYRVRLFQFILALDQHAKSPPAFKDPKSNVWNVVRTPEMLPPDKQQVEITRVDLKELDKQEKRAREMFELVVKEHPRTPWARRAQYELNAGFGMRFAEHFHDPRYYEFAKRNYKLPKF